VAVFGVFLLGRLIVLLVFRSPQDSAAGSDPSCLGLICSSSSQFMLTLTCLYVSILGVVLGAFSMEVLPARSKKRLVPSSQVSQHRLRTLRTSMGLLLTLSALCHLLDLVLAARYVFDHGYLTYYLQAYYSPLPSIVTIPGAMLPAAFPAYMLARPTRRAGQYAIAIYLAVSAVSLFTYQRSEFILALCVVAVFVISRRASTVGPARRVRFSLALVLIPTGLLLLNGMLWISRTRLLGGTTTQRAGLTGFLDEQGASLNVVALAIDYRTSLPQGRNYLLGPLFEKAFGLWMSLLRHPNPFAGQSVERALEGQNLAHILSYLYMPNVYLSGGGLGSSFVAELFVTAGVPGVFLGSLVLGVVLAFLPRLIHRTYLTGVLALLIVRSLLWAPRGSYLGVIIDLVNPSTLFVLALCSLSLIQSNATRPRDFMKATRHLPPRLASARLPCVDGTGIGAGTLPTTRSH